MGEYLHKKGHTVWGILFPDHGTKVNDLELIRFYHYIAVADYYLKELLIKNKKVYIIGYSMERSVALRLAQLHGNKLRGITIISTAVFFNGFYKGKFILHSPFLIFSGIVRHFIDIVKLNRERSLKSPPDFVGYKFQYPLKALHSFKVYLSIIRKNLHKIRIPIGVIINEFDKTVPKESIYYILENVKSIYKKALFFRFYEEGKTGHVVIRNDQLQKYILKFIEEFCNEVD